MTRVKSGSRLKINMDLDLHRSTDFFVINFDATVHLVY